MSVRTWKRVITVTVLIVILGLSSSTIFFICENNELKKENTLIAEQNLSIAEECDHLTQFLGLIEDSSMREYTKEFTNLYVENDFEFIDNDNKIVYLTFDDGPNAIVTPQILDTLKNYDIKATFFVIYGDSPEQIALYKRIVDEGHTLAVHTASHKYSNIYASVEAYLSDFEMISNHIENVTGVKPDIFRFPGGSINGYNANLYDQLIPEMLRRGYTYYDWNVSSGDATVPKLGATAISNNIINGCSPDVKNIVLLHRHFLKVFFNRSVQKTLS